MSREVVLQSYMTDQMEPIKDKGNLSPRASSPFGVFSGGSPRCLAMNAELAASRLSRA